MSSRRKVIIGIGALAVGLGGALFACTAAQRPDGGEGLLEVGKPAPKLTGVDQNGTNRSLPIDDFVVVYFYPKDGTPGCTEEACAFRDAWTLYEEAGVMIYGVSTDDADSHKSFAAEHDLPFPLIADPDKTWANAFGVGTFLGMTERVSFLIDPKGMVVAQYPSVDPGVHASQVLKDVERLRTP